MKIFSIGSPQTNYQRKLGGIPILMLFILLKSNPLLAQENIQFEPIAEFSSAIDFCFSIRNNFYVIEGQTQEILEIDFNGNKIKRGGGFGWAAGLFDSPSAIFSNFLTVYVTDKNNHRVQSFDKDLNYIGSLITQLSGFGNFKEIRYPSDCIIDLQGDYFILDSENNRVAKFDPFGSFIMDFGGINMGNFSLHKPGKLLLLNETVLSVLDESRLIAYDFFGNGLSIVPLPEAFSSIAGTESVLLGAAGNLLYKKDITKSGSGWVKFAANINENIIKVNIKNGIVFALTKTALYRSIEKQ